jgi:hypothetical protein
VFRVIVPADDQLSMNENDSENIESADEEEEQEDDGNETGEEVVNDNDGEEDEDAEEVMTEAEAETEDSGDQYVCRFIIFTINPFFVLGSRTLCIWRILKKLFRTFEFLAIVSFNVLLFIKISIPTLKKCGVYQADLVDTYLKKTYKGLPFLPK